MLLALYQTLVLEGILRQNDTVSLVLLNRIDGWIGSFVHRPQVLPHVFRSLEEAIAEIATEAALLFMDFLDVLAEM